MPLVDIHIVSMKYFIVKYRPWLVTRENEKYTWSYNLRYYQRGVMQWLNYRRLQLAPGVFG